MKRVAPIIILLFISLQLYSQDSPEYILQKWRQKPARLNFAVKPVVEFGKVGGNYDFTLSLHLMMTLNDKWFLGTYVTKKPLRRYTDYFGVNFDANFQHWGVFAGQNIDLGLYRTKGGHYVRRKTKVAYALKGGVGLVWLDDENNTRASESDYFFLFQPSVGATRPVATFIHVEAGIYYTALFKINKLDYVYDNSDFSGPGAYLAVRFNIFR